MGKSAKAGLLFLIAGALFCPAGQSGDPPALPLRTAWDGVYVNPQADRGEVNVFRNCSQCHNGEDQVLFSSEQFFDDWREERLSTLFHYMQTRMPAHAPGSLGEWEYLDIIAYILQLNGYPEGSTDLLPSHLDGIVLIGAEGHQPLPAGTSVYAVGCLRQTDTGWSLIAATRPSRSRFLPETEESFKQLDTQPLGSGRVWLHGKFDAVGSLNAKVYVKGSMTFHNGESGIDLSTVRVLSPNCGPPPEN